MHKKLILLCTPLLLFPSMVASAQNLPQRVQASPYVVDGLPLGGHVRFDSDAYRQYQCNPSEKFSGFTWCHKEKTETASGSEVIFANSILHAPDGTAWYVNRYIEPASFGPNDAQNEIDRLSTKYGEPVKVLRLPPRLGLPDAVISVWGKIELEQLDTTEASTVASGGSVRGLLISYLGDLQKSAKANVPVYRLAGGAGYLWAATFSGSGQGVLRFLTVDVTQIAAPNVDRTTPPSQLPVPSLPHTSSTPSEPPAGQPTLNGRFSVPMTVDGGVYAVPVLINDAVKLDFVVDSGAADVSIPADVARTLIRTGTIGPSDFVGQETYVLADASKAPSPVFILRSLKVGNHVVRNVRASIAPVQGSLLLGQSFLQQFQWWSVDNTRHVLVLE